MSTKNPIKPMKPPEGSTCQRELCLTMKPKKDATRLCGAPAKVLEGGKTYCTLHDPLRGIRGKPGTTCSVSSASSSRSSWSIGTAGTRATPILPTASKLAKEVFRSNNQNGRINYERLYSTRNKALSALAKKYGKDRDRAVKDFAEATAKLAKVAKLKRYVLMELP